MEKNIVTGERIQELADKFIGFERDFGCNPRIKEQRNKHLSFNDIINKNSYNNEPLIFCYGHNIENFAAVINTFANPFTLITHNSDQNVNDSPATNHILNNKNLVRWYAQNVNYRHPKLFFVPIGIANSMWPHGNLSMFESVVFDKPNEVYMNFEMATNHYKRYTCFVALSDKVEFLPKMDPQSNLMRMAKYKYCVCPEGNGLDTHRLWEAYYMRVVPILLRSTHTEILREQSGLPMILLDSWDNFDVAKLPPYESFDFEAGSHYLDIHSTFYKNVREAL
jgi:hypothetical protein